MAKTSLCWQFLGILIVAVAAPPNAKAENVERGLAVTKEWCGRCHAYDPEAPWNSIGNSPSFMLMAKKLESYEPRILTVTGRRPHIALEMQLTDEQLEDVVAYVITLKPE